MASRRSGSSGRRANSPPPGPPTVPSAARTSRRRAPAHGRGGRPRGRQLDEQVDRGRAARADALDDEHTGRRQRHRARRHPAPSPTRAAARGAGAQLRQQVPQQVHGRGQPVPPGRGRPCAGRRRPSAAPGRRPGPSCRARAPVHARTSGTGGRGRDLLQPRQDPVASACSAGGVAPVRTRWAPGLLRGGHERRQGLGGRRGGVDAPARCSDGGGPAEEQRAQLGDGQDHVGFGVGRRHLRAHPAVGAAALGRHVQAHGRPGQAEGVLHAQDERAAAQVAAGRQRAGHVQDAQPHEVVDGPGLDRARVQEQVRQQLVDGPVRGAGDADEVDRGEELPQRPVGRRRRRGEVAQVDRPVRTRPTDSSVTS